MSTEMVRVIGKAQQLADSMHDDYISTEHLLLGIVSESSSDVQELCREFGLHQDKIMSTIKPTARPTSIPTTPKATTRPLKNTAAT